MKMKMKWNFTFTGQGCQLATSSLIKVIAELNPRAKRARGRSPIAKEMW